MKNPTCIKLSLRTIHMLASCGDSDAIDVLHSIESQRRLGRLGSKLNLESNATVVLAW